MLKLAKQKLNNNSGVSILFSLLVLLVCLVTASIVVAAGSASGGRVADMTKMDKMYYNVNSAANMFVDSVLENGDQQGELQIVVKRGKTTVRTYQEIAPAEGSDEGFSTKEISSTTTYDFSYTSPTDLDFVLTDATLTMVFGKQPTGLSFGSNLAETSQRQIQWNNSVPMVSDDVVRNYTLTQEPDSDSGLQDIKDGMTVDVVATLEPTTRRLKLIFGTEQATTASDVYKCRLVLEAEHNYELQNDSERLSVEPLEGAVQITTRETSTKVDTFTWKVVSLEKV